VALSFVYGALSGIKRFYGLWFILSYELWIFIVEFSENEGWLLFPALGKQILCATTAQPGELFSLFHP